MSVPVTIVATVWFTTKQRIKVAQEALASWVTNLKYDGELKLHIADDGSTLSWKPEKIWKGPITYSRQERHGVGASLNAGMKEAFKTSPIWAYFVDDWELQKEFDITPWVQLLDKEDIGEVRLGPPHPFIRGEVLPLNENWQSWGIILEPYAHTVGHRPSLFHKRFTDFYGEWDEDVSALECERLASVRYSGDLKVVYALYHPWYHQPESLSTSGVQPNG